MTAKGEVAPVRRAVAERQGRTLGFFFAQILPPEAPALSAMYGRRTHHSDLAISSFMISLVPP